MEHKTLQLIRNVTRHHVHSLMESAKIVSCCLMSWVVKLTCQTNVACLLETVWSVLNITTQELHLQDHTFVTAPVCPDFYGFLMWSSDIPWHDMIDDQRLSFALGTLVQVPEEADGVFQHCPGQCLPCSCRRLSVCSLYGKSQAGGAKSASSSIFTWRSSVFKESCHEIPKSNRLKMGLQGMTSTERASCPHPEKADELLGRGHQSWNLNQREFLGCLGTWD